MMQRLTAKEDAFCRHVAIDGMSLSDAYRASRDCSKMRTSSINSNAKKMARRGHVRLRIEQLRGQVTISARGLTPKQDAFCLYYLETSNASEAYRRAYEVAPTTKTHTVNRNAHALLQDTKIAARIAELRTGLQQRHQVTVDRLVEEHAKLAFANMLDYVQIGRDGQPFLDFSQLTREQAAAICEVTSETVLTSGPADEAGNAECNGKRKVAVMKTKFKLHDKKGSLDSLGKHLGMFKADNEQAGKAAAEATAAAVEVSNRDLARAVLDILREAKVGKAPAGSKA